MIFFLFFLSSLPKMIHTDWIKEQLAFTASLPVRFQNALRCYTHVNIRYAIYLLATCQRPTTLLQITPLIQPLDVIYCYCIEVEELRDKWPKYITTESITYNDHCYLISVLQQLLVDIQYIITCAPKSPTLFMYSPIVNPEQMELVTHSFQNCMLSIQSMLPCMETGYYKIKVPKHTPLLLLSVDTFNKDIQEIIMPIGGSFRLIAETKSEWKTNATYIKMVEYSYEDTPLQTLIQTTEENIIKLITLDVVPKKINFTRT